MKLDINQQILIMVILVLSVGAMAIVASKQKTKSAFGMQKPNLCLASTVSSP